MFYKALRRSCCGVQSCSSLLRCLRALELLNAHLGALGPGRTLTKAWKQRSSSSSDGRGPRLSACRGRLLTVSNIFIPVLSLTLEVGFHFSHFIDQKKESQKGELFGGTDLEVLVEEPVFLVWNRLRSQEN